MSAEDLSILVANGWLASQPADFRAWVSRAGRWRGFEKGQALYQFGDAPDGLFGLAAGILEIQVPLDADEQITIHRAEPGFWIGESAILARTARSITVIAATKCRLLFIPASAMRAIVEEKPQYWYCFFELSHINASRAVATLAEVFSRSPQERLARMLLRLADADGRINATQEDLSHLIGMTRSSLRRILAEVIDSGTVETGYRTLRVVDRAGLQALIGKRSPRPDGQAAQR